MSSGKKRRTSGQKAEALDRSRPVRFSVYLAFVGSMFLLSMNAPTGSVLAASQYQSFIMVSALALIAVVVLALNHAVTADRAGRSFLTLGAVTLHVAFVRLATTLVDANDWPEALRVLLVPYVMAPLLLSVLVNRRAGVFGTIMPGLLGGLFMPQEWLLPFYIISFSCGLVVVYITQEVRKRGRLLRAGLYGGLVVLLFAFVFEIVGRGASLNELLSEGGWEPVALKCGLALGIGFITALLVSGLLPILESIFAVTTDLSWIELSDLNHKLLRQMQLEAPGTFHHSLIVASLSETAAEKVGANAAMCRVCAYFHDIGKLKKPEYFIENQNEQLNPHDTLTPTMSALVIIAHVKDGVDIALQNKLNPRIIDVIKEHHGDSLVYYFYRKAQEQKAVDDGDEVSGRGGGKDDLPEINEKNFRYPGPRPRSVESGIISLADAVESASRTLKKPTPAKIRALVDEIVMSRVRDGQLDECALTMRDLRLVRESFASTLRSMLHSRIDYPKDDEGTSRPDEDGDGKKSAIATKKAAKNSAKSA